MQSAALCLFNMLNRFVAIRCEQLLFIMNCTFSISITLSSFINFFFFFVISIVLSLLLLHFYAVYLNFCFIMFVICSTAKSIKVGLNLNIFFLFCVHLFIYNFIFFFGIVFSWIALDIMAVLVPTIQLPSLLFPS